MRRFVVALALLAGGASPGCGRPASEAVTESREAARDGEDALSLYDLDLTLRDQQGRTVRLEDLRGRTHVAAMFFTACQSVCPRITEDLKAIERGLPPALRDRTSFVLFSLDPGHDTPDALREFARAHRLDPAHWTLLAAPEDGVRDLSAVLGVRYRLDEGGELAHSALIVVIDPRGSIVHRQIGLGNRPDELIEAVRAAG